MPTIKIRLEEEEFDAVERLAEKLHLKSEDVAYSALNRLMLAVRAPDVRNDISQTRDWRRANLPLWSDSAWSVHIYEGQPDDEPKPSPYH
ncbi:MAG: hypothetical protein KGJ37_00035 [Verrucomicrobiota bacterium]|nr:hypothetical protein [Verrucomicrobiota bacterium]